MHDDTVDINVCLIPDPETLAHAVVMNRRFRPHGDEQPVELGISPTLRNAVRDHQNAMHELVAGGINPIADIPGTHPHITLLQRRVRRSSLVDVFLAIGQVAAECAKARLATRGVFAGGFVGYEVMYPYVFRKVALTHALECVHLTVAEGLRGIDADLSLPLSERSDGRDVGEWRRYGWLHAGANYNPHLTLATIRPEGVEAAESLPKSTGLLTGYWHAREITVGLMGPRGTVVGVAATASLRDGTTLVSMRP